MDRSAARLRTGCLTAAALLLVLVFPATGIAAPGGSQATALPLIVGASTAGTLTASPEGVPPFACYYRLDLSAGQTIVATFTASADLGDPNMMWGDPSGRLLELPYRRFVPPSAEVLNLLASRAGTYYLRLSASQPGTFTVDTAVVPALKYSLSGLSAPKTARHRRPFGVEVTLYGIWDQAGEMPVWFVVERWSRGKWRRYSAAAPSTGFGDPNARFTLSTSLRLPRGSFRIRTRFKDAAHPTALYNRWKYVSVKR
jgi:hypothetical protein